MKIEYQTGDLLKGRELFIAHGCNAQGVMGSGVAKAIRDAYPEAYTAYREVYEKSGLRVGGVVAVHIDHKSTPDGYKLGRFVFNAITQEFYGRDPNRVYVSYDGMRAAMREMNDHVLIRLRSESAGEPERIAMPLIGAGLANGKWSIISQIIEEEATIFQPVVYLLDGKMPDG